jgi:hypothetical protein
MAEMIVQPWDKPTDTGYTWYKDDSILRILPTGKTLTYDEVTAYYPVTAHTFTEEGSLELRADGDISFTARIEETGDPDYNSHALYLYTENNTGNSQQVSYIKLVGYSGSSAYSATTILQKNPNTIEKRMYLQANGVTAGSGDTRAQVSVITQNCTFSRFTVTQTGGNWSPTAPTLQKQYNNLYAEFSANLGNQRSATYSITLYDTDDNGYNVFFVLTQEAGQPEPPQPPDTGDTGETGYTYYYDPEIFNILPTARTLQYDEVQAYYPVTAHTITGGIDVINEGDVDFVYRMVQMDRIDPNYNSHALYVDTFDNSGETRLESTIKLIGYVGDSAYSASTLLFKQPESHAFVTASPNPVNAQAGRNSISVYLSFTNCQRSIEDELTGNTQLDGIDWLTVSRLSDTAISFTFAENQSEARHTYYMAYGRNPDNQLVYCRIDLYQEAGGSKYITLTPSRSSLSKDEGSFSVFVESTDEGSFSFEAAPWMRVTSYSPQTNKSGTAYISYYANTNEWPRTGDIRVTQQISSSPYTLSASTTISQANGSEQTATLTVTPTAMTVNKEAGNTTFAVAYTGLASAPALVDGGGNMNIISQTFDGQSIIIIYGANDTTFEKSKVLYITAATPNGDVLSREINITQLGKGLPVAPVWRDYQLDLQTPGIGYINYSVIFNGATVYTGRAYAYPGADGAVIFFNQLVKNYLSNKIEFIGGYQTVNDWLGNFTITSPELGNITSVAFYEDYSYENRQMQNVMTLNNPITHEVPEGGFVPLSFFVTGDTGTVQIRTNKRINN